MAESILSEIDVINELPYRLWARQHYVPYGQRNDEWHSVILEEMQRKDEDGVVASSVSAAATDFEPHAFGSTSVTTTLMACVGYTRFDAGA